MMIQNNPSRVIVALMTTLLLLAGCQNIPVDTSNFVVDPTKVCRFDAKNGDPCFDVIQNWKETVDNLLEVSATDFTHGDFVGTDCEGEDNWVNEWQFLYFNSWQPFDGFKHSMSATLHHFNWAHGYSGADEDWNLHVIPTPPFSFLISDVEALHDESVAEHSVCGDLPCMEVEISPDKSFWTNPWFFLPGVNPADRAGNGYSTLDGRQMGFYGLWVMDANHDFASEIHPVDMMWFKDHFEPFDVFWLMLLQDNTGRFDDQDNFDCGGIIGDNIPAGWEPWSQSPRSGQFNIAFEVDPDREVVNFNIHELRRRFVVTKDDPNARQDADEGNLHGLEYNGKVVVRVQENQANNDDLGVTFTNLYLTSDGKLRGFISIRSKIGGDDDKDEEGYHILWVTRSKSSTRPDAPLSDVVLPRLLITSKGVDRSLKTDGKYFTGDIQFTLEGNDTTTDRDYTISKVEFASQDIQQEIKFEQNQRTKEVLMWKLPLVTDGKIIITSASGLTFTHRILSLGLAPSIKEMLTHSVVDTDAWKFLSASVGGIPSASLPNDKKLTNFQEFQLRLYPFYGPYKETRVLTDVTSTFARELNQAILRNDQKRLEFLFKSAQPFTITWTFEATNLAKGKSVPVYTDNKHGSEGVQIELLSTDYDNDSLRIKFLSPGSAGIVECRVQASVTDAMGHTTIVTHRLWSHGFDYTMRNVDELATLIQALTGFKDRSALIPSPIERKPQQLSLPPDVKTSHAQIMNAYLREAVKDKKVTIEELRNIIRALKSFSVN